ncbi:M1 family metallopeptidase [Hyalangium versicolor]|uniref:M1 family metallopeptidase n=1 Tax=Hyalangium versicolor TaxID=2861190 RepID=UPI001CCD7BDB|nr:M1 family metallopeptidase [Hyalangium versicolor]
MRLLPFFALLLTGLLTACGARQNVPDAETAAPPASAQAATPASPPPSLTPPRLRLPTTVRPTGYTVELTVDPTAETFQGVEEVALEVAEPTSVLWLNGKALTVKQATVTQGGASIAVTQVPGTDEFLGFTFASPLAKGPATLRITYEAVASTRELDGAFRNQEGGDWYLFTEFEPLDARRVFPCFDEPSFKVPWQLTLHVPKGNVAVSNTSVQAEESRPDGGRTFRFARTPPLPSYLIAFAVGPFDFLQAAPSGRNKVPTRIITPKGRAAEGAYAAKVTPEIIARLEDYFGIPYPFEKLDTLAVPLLGGAMEHPGLVTFNSEMILAKESEDSTERQRDFADTQVHELGHQWFGNLVTLSWWDDLWLNEAFATWITPRIIEVWQPTWDAPVQSVQMRSLVLESDSLVSARRIRQPIENDGDVQNAFDTITYGKGSAVLEMTEEWLGREVFQRGVQRYLRAHARGNATAKDFLDALSAEAGQDVGKVLSTFLDQGGAPVVSAVMDCSGKTPKVVLSQRRYLPLGSPGVAAQTWHVPLCVRYGVGATTGRACTVLETERAELPLPEAKSCPDWLYPNAGGAGYYRAEVKGDALRKLVTAADKRLTRTERVALLGDTYALTKAGLLPAADALSLAVRFAQETDRQVFNASLELLGLVEERQLPEARREDFHRFLRDTYGARARKLGFTPRAGENEDTRLLRPLLLGLAGGGGGDPVLVAEARKLAGKWLADPRAVDPELVGTVLGIAAKYAGSEFVPKFQAALKMAKERKLRQQLIHGLSGVRDPQLLRQLLPMLLDPANDAREWVWMMIGAAYHPATRDVVYAFVKENYDALVARLPEDFAAHLSRVGGSWCDAEHRKDVADYFGERSGKEEGGARVLSQVLESIDLCIAQKAAQGASIEAFLTQGPVKVPASK